MPTNVSIYVKYSDIKLTGYSVDFNAESCGEYSSAPLAADKAGLVVEAENSVERICALVHALLASVQHPARLARVAADRGN